MALTIRAVEALLNSGSDSPLGRLAPGLSYLGYSKRRTPTGGEQWVLQYESPANNDQSLPSPAEAGYSLIPTGYTAELNARGPTHTLTVTTPDDPSGGTTGVISSTYELLGNALQKDIREHPYSLDLGYEAIKRIDQVLKGDYEESILQDDDLPLYRYLLQRNGTAAFQISQYVLRWTRVANYAASIPIAYSNVERIYTTAQMLNETGPPIGILASVQNAATASTPEKVSPGHMFGWLKQTPTVTQTVGSKAQISSEWWLAEWTTSPPIYAAAS